MSTRTKKTGAGDLIRQIADVLDGVQDGRVILSLHKGKIVQVEILDEPWEEDPWAMTAGAGI
ncbi:MAG: hypothetical protein GX606_00740 [Elusimicrobia bacterium]|nr:hypothetical protein [Elusimicrobiota bacterium]